MTTQGRGSIRPTFGCRTTGCPPLLLLWRLLTCRRRFGWVHRAISLDRLQRPAEAKEVLLSAVEKLGPCSTFAFHLACVCTRLGQLVEAKRWVKEAIDLAPDKPTLDRLRLRVLDESALAEFWRKIGEVGD